MTNDELEGWADVIGVDAARPGLRNGMNAGDEMADVFISYKKQDRALAEKVEAALTREGYTVWWDTSLHPRESWDAIIQREISEAAAVVVIWTPRAVQSEWVRIEANYGKQNKKLVPLLAEPCDIPLAFSLTQAANLTDWDGAVGHPGWRQALDWIGALMDSDDGPDPLPEEPPGQPAPATSPSTQPLVDDPSAAKMWAGIEDSLDPRDYEDFRDHFPSSKLTFEARRRIRQLEDWAKVDENDHAGINAFRAEARAKSPLFPALEQRTALIRDLARTKDREAERAAQAGGQEGPDERPVFDPNRYVFISHPSSIDPEIVRLVVRGLIESGMPVWLYEPSAFDFDPKELVSMSWQKAGGSYLNQALEAVSQASCVVMLTGRTTGEGGFQTTELATALAAGKPMVAAIVDDLPFDELPEGLKDRFVPRIDAEGLKSGRTLPMLISDIWSASEAPPKPPRKSRNALWAMLGLGILAAAGLGLAWAAGVFAQSIEAEGDPIATTEGGPPPALRPGDTFRDCDECPEMVVVPTGTYLMGSPTDEEGRSDFESPLQTVRIQRPFAIGRSEVNWSQWEACVAAGVCSIAGVFNVGGDEGWGREDQPIINVSFSDALAFSSWLSTETGFNYRIPSEAEWEYVARGITEYPYALDRYGWGNDKPTCEQSKPNRANTRECNLSRPAAVRFSEPNKWGIFDLHGNVWEWTADCWNISHLGGESSGNSRAGGQCDYRVIKGGSWDNSIDSLRSANRRRRPVADRRTDLGFRVARDLD